MILGALLTEKVRDPSGGVERLGRRVHRKQFRQVRNPYQDREAPVGGCQKWRNALRACAAKVAAQLERHPPQKRRFARPGVADDHHLAVRERLFERDPPFLARQRAERDVDFVDSEEIRLGPLGSQAPNADLARVVLEGSQIGVGVVVSRRRNRWIVPPPPIGECLGNQGTHAGGVRELTPEVAAQLLLEMRQLLFISLNLFADSRRSPLRDEAVILAQFR